MSLNNQELIELMDELGLFEDNHAYLVIKEHKLLYLLKKIKEHNLDSASCKED